MVNYPTRTFEPFSRVMTIYLPQKLISLQFLRQEGICEFTDMYAGNFAGSSPTGLPDDVSEYDLITLIVPCKVLGITWSNETTRDQILRPVVKVPTTVSFARSDDFDLIEKEKIGVCPFRFRQLQVGKIKCFQYRTPMADRPEVTTA